MRKNIAVILSAGTGNRSGFDMPKQLVKLAGKPVVEHTIKAFNSDPLIHEIAIVTNGDCKSEIENIVLKSGFHKVKRIINGGKERWESSWSAICAYESDPEKENINLIFHDSVRPLVDSNIIKNVVQALNSYKAVDVVIPATDTIVQSKNDGKFIDKIPARDKLRYGQTPQGFHYNTIRSAYEKYLESSDLLPTDDCGIVLNTMPEVEIFLADGNQYNQKLTYKEDLAILDKLFQFKSSKLAQSAESLNDLSKFKDEVCVVFGHNSGIGKEIYSILKNQNINVYGFSRREGTDIQNLEDVQKALESVYKETGKIHHIINTAGILIKQPLANMNHTDILKVIGTNYIGAVNIAHTCFEYLKQTQGSLLFFTSSSYTYGRAFYSTYSSSKAAVVNLTQALAEEWSSFGIRVNCVNPERTLTPMRTAAFGFEKPDTLLDATTVANASLNITFSDISGLIVDVKRS